MIRYGCGFIENKTMCGAVNSAPSVRYSVFQKSYFKTKQNDFKNKLFFCFLSGNHAQVLAKRPAIIILYT